MRTYYSATGGLEFFHGTPGPNTAQNKQFRDAVKEIEKQIGNGLKDNQIDQLHDEISGKNYSYWDIVEEGIGMFDKSYKN